MAPLDADLAGQESAGDRLIGAPEELRRDGPFVGTFLLADGLILQDIDPRIHTLDDGRLRVALQYDRTCQASVVVFDREASCLYTLGQIYPGMAIAPDAAFDRVSSGSSQAIAFLRAAFPHATRKVVLHKVLGLLVDQATPAPPAYLTRRLRNGSLLAARLLLPADLRGASDPGRMLELAPYSLSMDGQDTGLHVPGLQHVLESPDGSCLMLAGVILQRDTVTARTWHIWRAGRWQMALERSQVPYLDPEAGSWRLVPVAIDDAGVVQCDLDQVTGRQAPGTVKLRVNWKRMALTLQVKQNRVTFTVPA